MALVEALPADVSALPAAPVAMSADCPAEKEEAAAVPADMFAADSDPKALLADVDA
jgi:hypothetical protein